MERVSSLLNQTLYVTLDKGTLKLSTQNAIYSFGSRYDNFGSLLKELDYTSMDEVLILGLGLGSIPVIMEEASQNSFHFTFIEKDEEVVYLASKYTIPFLRSSCQIICSDIGLFLMTHEQQYHFIAMDVFIDDKIPQEFQTAEFLEMLSMSLYPKGLLIYNMLAFNEEDKRKAEQFFHSIFKIVFPESKVQYIKGNMMFTGIRCV